jgi:hypothetical protein
LIEVILIEKKFGRDKFDEDRYDRKFDGDKFGRERERRW